jgi:hypothetical protein
VNYLKNDIKSLIDTIFCVVKDLILIKKSGQPKRKIQTFSFGRLIGFFRKLQGYT